MTVAEIIRLVQLQIRPVAMEEDLQQAKELVGAVLGLDPPALMLHHGMEITGEQLAELGALVARRASGEPLQYILSQWSFMGLTFSVGPGVLIPRADTETLCEEALRLAKERGYKTALDLCCGSGCIGVALRSIGGLAVTCADISEDCVRATRENAALNGVMLEIVQGDLFEAVAGRRYDLMACNPPYLSRADMDALQTEVGFEPRLALYGGADGLDFYRRIAADYGRHLNAGGALLLEIGSTQAEDVCALFDNASAGRDYAGNPRVVTVYNGGRDLTPN